MAKPRKSSSASAEQPQVKPLETPTPTPQQMRVPITRAATVTDYYANHVGISVSPWDLTLRFGKIIPASGSDTPKVEEGLLVYMSPQHAKAFLLLLQAQVGAYETMFHKILLPSQDQAGITDG